MGKSTEGNLSNHHLVCVIWDDAHMTMEEYNETEVERDFHKPARVHTYGLLVKSDTTGVSVAMQEEPNGTHPFRQIGFIPRAMVIEEIDLGSPRRKRERKKKEAPST